MTRNRIEFDSAHSGKARVRGRCIFLEPHRALWFQHEIVSLHAIEHWHGVIAYFEVPIGVVGAGIKKHRGHGIEYALKLLFGDWNNVKAWLIWRLRRHLRDSPFIKSDVKPLTTVPAVVVEGIGCRRGSVVGYPTLA